MLTPLQGFFHSRPSLAKGAVLGLLCVTLGLAAFFGLQVHGTAQTRTGVVLEWAAFLASLAACLIVLLAGARWLTQGRSEDPDVPGGDQHRPGA